MSEEGLWIDNPECPNCGKPINPDIQSCATGFSYCSYECANEHVNKIYREIGDE